MLHTPRGYPTSRNRTSSPKWPTTTPASAKSTAKTDVEPWRARTRCNEAEGTTALHGGGLFVENQMDPEVPTFATAVKGVAGKGRGIEGRRPAPGTST